MESRSFTSFRDSRTDLLFSPFGSPTYLGQGPFDARTHRGQVGILPQDSELHPNMPIGELLRFFARLQGMREAARATKWRFRSTPHRVHANDHFRRRHTVTHSSHGDEAATESTLVPFARPNAVAEAVSVLGAQIAVLALLLPSFVPHPGLVAASSAALALFSRQLSRRAKKKSKRQRIARVRDDIVFSESTRIPAANIREIDLRMERARAPSAPREVLRMRWIDEHDCVIAELDFQSHEEAERFLLELDLGDARPARELSMVPRAFSFSTAAHRVLAAIGAVTLAVVATAGLGWISILSFPFVFFLGGAAFSGHIRVGDDGFEIRPAIGRRRFVGFDEVAHIERDGGVVEVRLKSGELIALAVAGARRGKWQAAHADAIAYSLRRGFARRRAPVRANLEEQLARGEREERAWRSALVALAHDGGYRGTSISEDQLLAAAANPHIDPSAREGAAIVLRERGVDLALLRELASRSAHPRVRVALADEIDETEEAAETSPARSTKRI